MMNKIIVLTEFQKEMLRDTMKKQGYGPNFIERYINDFGKNEIFIILPRQNGKLHLQKQILKQLENNYIN